MSLLEVTHLQQDLHYPLRRYQVEALHNVNFSVEEGEYVAIMGESGSGKTTLLNILAALDQPTSRTRWFSTVESWGISQTGNYPRSAGTISASFFRILTCWTPSPSRTISFCPWFLPANSYEEMEKKLTPIAQTLNIADILRKFPYEVSGGQKQRAAVARALITEPQIVLADEPTGALDSKASDTLLRLFGEINRAGQTILMVTHSVKAASHAKRVLFLRDGVVYHQLYRGAQSTEELFGKISDTLTVLAQGGELHA